MHEQFVARPPAQEQLSWWQVYCPEWSSPIVQQARGLSDICTKASGAFVLSSIRAWRVCRWCRVGCHSSYRTPQVPPMAAAECRWCRVSWTRLKGFNSGAILSVHPLQCILSNNLQALVSFKLQQVRGYLFKWQLWCLSGYKWFPGKSVWDFSTLATISDHILDFSIHWPMQCMIIKPGVMFLNASGFSWSAVIRWPTYGKADWWMWK